MDGKDADSVSVKLSGKTFAEPNQGRLGNRRGDDGWKGPGSGDARDVDDSARGRSIMPGTTAWQRRNAPRTITSMHSNQASASTSQSRPAGPGVPALFTRIVMGPSRRAVSSTAARIPAASLTSSGIAIARPPALAISAAVSSISCCVRANTPTEAPSAARASAMARPIPRPPPVTIATS